MKDIGQVLMSLYGLASLVFTAIFEYRFFVEEGFVFWLFIGSWLAVAMGALWPLTMWLLK
jgi:hypothetical protein